jgi:hypothetical protein
MNGLALSDIRSFFRWWFSQRTEVTASPADIDQHFFGFDYDEFLKGKAGNINTIAAGLSRATHTGADGELDYQVSNFGEKLSLDVVLVKMCGKDDIEAQEAAYDACKTVLFDLVSWIYTQAVTDGQCTYPIVGKIDPGRFSHERVGPVADGYYGWKVRIYLRASLNKNITFDPVTAPPLWHVPEGSVAYFTAGAWTYEQLNLPTSNGNYVLKILNGVKSWVTAAAGATWGSITGTLSNQTDLQNALDAKSNTGHTHDDRYYTETEVDGLLLSKANASHTHTISDVTGLATAITTAENNAKAYADTLVVGLIDDRGNYDASGNVFPSTGGSGSGGAILKGDLWTVSVAGTLGGNAVIPGDLVRALVDAPGQTSSNWAVTENNIGYVAENQSNKATSMTGNEASNTVYLSAKAIYDWATAMFTTAVQVGAQITTALIGYATEAWVTANFQAKNPTINIDIFDDFIGYVGMAGQGSTVIYPTALHSVYKDVSFGVTSPSYSNKFGVIRLDHSTNTLNNSSFIWSNTMRGDSGAFTNTYYFKTGALPGATKDFEYSVGLGSINLLSGTPNAIIFYYKYNSNGGRWSAITRSASVTTSTNTGITVVANTWYKLEIVYNLTDVKFYINDVLVATNTTNIPTSGLVSMVYMYIFTSNFTNVGFEVDYIRYQKTLTSR